jgi:hypothetical protein
VRSRGGDADAGEEWHLVMLNYLTSLVSGGVRTRSCGRLLWGFSAGFGQGYAFAQVWLSVERHQGVT